MSSVSDPPPAPLPYPSPGGGDVDTRGERTRWGPPRRRRPPWWPENEPWPPTGPPSWVRRRRGRFIWRFGAFFAGVVLVTAMVGTIGVWLVANSLGVISAPPALRLASIAVIVLGALAIAGAGRTFRRVATRFGDLVEAAGRIESGDYSVRLAERGPGEVRSLTRAFNAMSARLQVTDARRRSFLADVTHELRTPLSIIRGQAEAIGDGLYPADPAHVAPILEATRTLERLVEDLGTLALSETGSLVLAREPVDLAVLVNSTLASFSGSAEAAGVRLFGEIAGDVPLVLVDPARISGVLRNLLANAIRHTPAGGSVRVHAGRSGAEVVVEVRDTGSGISPDLLPRVFERFVKGPGSTGSGLGLAIARDVVQAHGGTIEAASQEGEGTTVRFTLPTSDRS
jgi:two-component system, OmpR family, sensor histidine kinase BaeS